MVSCRPLAPYRSKVLDEIFVDEFEKIGLSRSNVYVFVACLEELAVASVVLKDRWILAACSTLRYLSSTFE